MAHSNTPNYQTSTYGDAFADIYDDWYQNVTDIEGTVDIVTSLAQGQKILELGVGTGRLALPIALTGAAVCGVDSSSAMLDHLAKRDHSHLIETHLMDMASRLPKGPFRVIFCAYNTFFNLTGPNDQESCLELVRERLEPEGRFVLEAFVPSSSADLPTRGTESRHTANATVMNITIREPTSKLIRGQSVEIKETAITLRPWRIRVRTPAELDHVAGRHGLRLLERWEDWRQTPFTNNSDHHVSVYAPIDG